MHLTRKEYVVLKTIVCCRYVSRDTLYSLWFPKMVLHTLYKVLRNLKKKQFIKEYQLNHRYQCIWTYREKGKRALIEYTHIHQDASIEFEMPPVYKMRSSSIHHQVQCGEIYALCIGKGDYAERVQRLENIVWQDSERKIFEGVNMAKPIYFDAWVRRKENLNWSMLLEIDLSTKRGFRIKEDLKKRALFFSALECKTPKPYLVYLCKSDLRKAQIKKAFMEMPYNLRSEVPFEVLRFDEFAEKVDDFLGQPPHNSVCEESTKISSFEKMYGFNVS